MSNIAWTPKQLKIYKELQANIPVMQIAKNNHCSGTSVTRVKNAIKSGQIPPQEKLLIIKNQEEADKALQQSAPPEVSTDAKTQQEQKPKEPYGQSSPGNKQQEEATIAKLVPVPTYIPITPIMMSAKSYVIQRLGWSPDVRWQDLIDTIFFHYFKSLNPPVTLHGWVEGETKSNSPKPASEKAGGNGGLGIDVNDPQAKQLIHQVAVQLVNELVTVSSQGAVLSPEGDEYGFTP